MSMIGFRVDGNSQIGTGHLMRCLSIAKKMKRDADGIVFFTADLVNKNLIEENGFFCRILDSHYKELEQEISFLPDMLVKEHIETLIVDSYFVTQTYLESLQKITKVVYIDDLHEMIYPCDMLINYTIFADSIDYPKLYGKRNTRLLLGCKYAPLRDEFEEELKKEIRDKVENILVLSGGTDQYHFILNFVEKIASSMRYNKIHFHIVCGRYNMDKEALEKIAKEHQNISIYENLTKLRSFMVDADIAISAGGTTLYELAACGTVTIGYSLADNQLENLDFFAKKECLISVGDIREAFPEKFLLEKLDELSDKKKRTELSFKMRQLVDGKGCKRLAEEILKQ